MAVGDLNGDGRRDLAVANAESFGRRSNVSVLLGDETGGVDWGITVLARLVAEVRARPAGALRAPFPRARAHTEPGTPPPRAHRSAE